MPATSRPALTALGPWYDACPVGCCANPRGEKPAVAGLERVMALDDRTS